MATHAFPELNTEKIAETRDAVHAYAQVIGDWRSSCLARQKPRRNQTRKNT